MRPKLRDTQIEKVRRQGLRAFARMAWPIVEPAKQIWNWHLDAICDHLTALHKRQIRQLIINVPPGTGKSLTVSTMFPAWVWIQDPGFKMIYASYDPSLSARDAARSIQILGSDWFINRWGARLARPNPPISNYESNKMGFRFSTSVRGKATGRHADLTAVDDPIKPIDADGKAAISMAMLNFVVSWWGGTMATRQVDQRTALRLIMMQRLHEYDLAGAMLEEGGYTHLCLPMQMNPKRKCVIEVTGFEDPRTKPGELLHPERYPKPIVKALRKKLGPSAASAQLDQDPTPPTGGIIKKEFIAFWHPLGPKAPKVKGYEDNLTVFPPDPSEGQVILSTDCAFKDAEDNDWVAIGAIQSTKNAYWIRDVLNEHLSLPMTCIRQLTMAKRWPRAITKLIEDKANGPGVIQTLQDKIPGILPIDPKGGKLVRAHQTAVIAASGCLYFPHPDLYPWAWDLLDQVVKFPRAKHDDMVDMLTQALSWLYTADEPWETAADEYRKELAAFRRLGRGITS